MRLMLGGRLIILQFDDELFCHGNHGSPDTLATETEDTEPENQKNDKISHVSPPIFRVLKDRI